jgi:ABC-type multidrug transport system ATPase subunit
MNSADEYVLRYRLGNEEWEEIPLLEGENLIGRGEDCDLIVKHELISRYHAKVILDERKIWLVDLGSTNGIQVDRQSIAPNEKFQLELGQNFIIGAYSLVIEAPFSQETLTDKTEDDESSMTYRLRYRSGSGSWVEKSLIDGDFIIGRGGECDVILDDKEISRRHAHLNVDGDRFWLADLGSKNGTQVDDRPLSPRRKTYIEVGQIFSVGPYSLYITSDDEPVQADVISIPSPDATRVVAGMPAIEAGQAAEMQTMIGAEDMAVFAEARTLNLSKHDRITIGRAGDNNVVLDHPMVSRYHASIERIGTRYNLRDTRSTNGVFINGKRIERDVWLKEWDEIRIGPYTFVLAGNNLQSQAEVGLQLDVRSLNQYVSSQLNLLQNISLTIRPMDFVALVGMSGSGKTTLLNAISGYRPASHGQVLVNSIDLYANYDLFRNDIGYVPQRDIVHAELTPESALGYVARLRMPPDTSSEERANVVSAVLEDLDLTERRNVPISRLSGGQLKRVSIGVELLTKPRLFFLDEPTSGLDPGTEYDMMKLMRRLADQGRTVMLVTHATKNVMLCDKVIFLARGGYLAFYGPPDEALDYFDQFRTSRERREKEMEFDDIYRILSDDTRGAPAGWDKRYRASTAYKYALPVTETVGVSTQPEPQTEPAKASKAQSSGSRVSSLRQFWILSARNLKIIYQDKVSLILMLALAPIIGLMDFIWGTNLYDPVDGDAAKIITMWFMMALITVLVGAMSSVREIVKEVDIYKRERAVNLKIFPYVSSKIWVGIVLALYQAGVLLFFKLLFVRPEVPDFSAYLAIYVTLILGTLLGYLIGLAISAGAPNQNAAMLLIIVVLVPQFLFAGALLPLDLIPGGETISFAMPTRWVFESFVRITGMGDQLLEDMCWKLEKSERLNLSDELKEICPCMGESIFTECVSFPGILSPDHYDETAAVVLAQAQPEEPLLPTSYPYPTAYPSPTALPTPTLLPSPTPFPTPEDPREMNDYMDSRQQQGDDYQGAILGQFDEYRIASQEQGQIYSEIRTVQGDEYAELREQQGDEYAEDMRIYGDDRSNWQEKREKAISSAEGLLGTIYDNYGQTFKGLVLTRWMAMIVIMLVLFGMVLFFQKRKDVV